MESSYSLADIASAIGNNGSGSSIWILVLFLFVIMGGGFYGNQRNFASQSDVQDGFNFQTLQDQFSAGRTTSTMAQDRILQGINDQTLTTMTAIKDTEAMVGNVTEKVQNCCCETNRNIDAVRYADAQNTSAILSAINADGEKTRALMNENTIQALRDKVSELSLAQSQCNQNAYLTNMLRPYPSPAYVVSSPYVGAGVPTGTAF